MVTIIDDDKPGFLSFKEKRNNIKQVASDSKCEIVVDRTNGSDGKITCKYKTIELKDIIAHKKAVEHLDYEPCEGELEFEHNEC